MILIKCCLRRIQMPCKLIRRSYAQRLELNTSENGSVQQFDAIPTSSQLTSNEKDALNLCSADIGPKLHEYIDNRHHELGPIFRETVGSSEAIFVSSPELMRAVFMYEGKYPKHPLPEAWTIYNQKHGCKRGLFFMDGEEWLHNRKIMNNLLLRNDTRWIQKPSEIVAKKFIKNLKLNIQENHSNKCDNQIEIKNLEKLLYRWSIDEIIILMLGNSYYDNTQFKKLENLIDIFAKNVHKIFEYSAKLPSPQHAELKDWSAFEESVKNTLELAKEIVDIAIDEINSKAGLLSDMRKHNISRDIIQRIFTDLIIAAGDTTAFSVQWALYLLARDTKIQSYVRSMILNQMTLDNYFETAVIRGIVRETMRLFPVAPFIGRYIATDAILGNYKIPKNTLVLLSLFTSGRDEKNFFNPLQFSPMRWNRENIIKGCPLTPHASLPFAIGSRSCIGRKIANTSMYILLTKILQNFELNLLNKNEIQPILRMVTVPSEIIRISVKAIE